MSDPTTPTQHPKPEYLGDAVYASFDGYALVLTTGHHEPSQAGDVVYLEPSVVKALVNYIARLPGRT